MKEKTKFFSYFLFLIINFHATELLASNQTTDISHIYNKADIPFTIKIEKIDTRIPFGLQSFCYGIHKDKILLIAGRTSGMHGFTNTNNNFPRLAQNTYLLVFDTKTQKISSRSLFDENSGLTLAQIESLSVTSAQFCQEREYLYIVGGYFVKSNQAETSSLLTKIHLPKLIKWVENTDADDCAVDAIQQVYDPFFQVTGGEMKKASSHDPFLLILGQNFPFFLKSNSNGIYTNQVRSFYLTENKGELVVIRKNASNQESYYRRRDSNVVPYIENTSTGKTVSYIYTAGVFTPSGGYWTVPIFIDKKGNPNMPDPKLENTFKQSMNVYTCANFSMYSQENKKNYIVLMGGLSYQVCENINECSLDEMIPFNNNSSVLVIDNQKNIKQHFLGNLYPDVVSTIINPGQTYFFGAEARFCLLNDIKKLQDDVISFDDIKKTTLIGYVFGGIASTVPNTRIERTETEASPYIFKLIIYPKK